MLRETLDVAKLLWSGDPRKKVSYEGTYELDEDVLADGSKLDEHFSSMGGWIASTLVRLGDLTFEFSPPDLTTE